MLVLIAGTDLLLGPQSTGGHPSYVQAHALAALRLGFTPHIFSVVPGSASRENESPRESEWGVLHRVPTPVRPLRAHMAQMHSPFIARAVSELLSDRRVSSSARTASASEQLVPHLIHGFGAWALGGVLVTRALAHRGIAAVPIASAYTTLEHESAGKLSGVRWRQGRAALEYPATHAWVKVVASTAEGCAYRRMRLILVNYDSVGELLQDAHGPNLPVQRIPYASALAFDPPAEMPSAQPVELERLRSAEGPLIVSVSRHDPRKGVDVLLESLAGLAREGTPFRACLVGPGPLLDANRAYASHLGLEGRVSIPGRVEEVMPYLRSADVYVLPSLEEGSGSVSLLEALQAGAPVVASRLDGIPEDLRDRRDALLVKPGDAGDLQRALAELLRDEAARATLAARARALYEERFSPAAFTAALGEVYARLGVRP